MYVVIIPHSNEFVGDSGMRSVRLCVCVSVRDDISSISYPIRSALKPMAYVKPHNSVTSLHASVTVAEALFTHG